MSFLTRVLLIGVVGAGAGVAHSWVVQAGEKPIKLGVDEDATIGWTPQGATEAEPAGSDLDPELNSDQVADLDPDQGQEPTPVTSEDAGGSPPVSVPDAGTPATEEPAPSGAIGFEVSIAEAFILYEQAGAQFLDARTPEEYDEGHVQGAFFMTPDMLREGYPRALEVLSTDVPTVIYCVGGDCDASHNVAKYLQDFGYQRLHIMTDGYPAWVDAGHPTEAGAEQRLAFE